MKSKPSFLKKIRFFLNGERFSLDPKKFEDVDITLLEFLRKKGYTGAKLACGEGGKFEFQLQISKIQLI